MTKLPTSVLSDRARICSELREKHAALDGSLDAFNAVVQHRWEAVDQARELYNEAVADAKAWCEEQVEAMEEYFNDHSERWQDGERGQAYRQWIDSYEQAELYEIELMAPESQQLDGGDQAERLEDLEEAFE